MGRQLEMVRIDPAAMESTPVPAQARIALGTVGLPRVVGETMGPLFSTSLDLFDKIPNLNEIRGASSPEGPSVYWWIGTDYGTDICIDARTGQVVSVDRDGSTRFVNTDVSRFVDALQMFHVTYLEPSEERSLGETDAEVVISGLRRIDEDALAGDAWWALIAEQLSEGLL